MNAQETSRTISVAALKEFLENTSESEIDSLVQEIEQQIGLASNGNKHQKRKQHHDATSQRKRYPEL